MIDSHCHLDAERFNPDRAQVLERAWSAGVSGIVVPAIGPPDWDELLGWPGRDPRVQIALGVHPQLLPEVPASEDEAMLRKMGLGQ